MVASAADNARLTGYGHGAVSPLGMREGADVPVVFPREAEKEVGFVWMGGGHVDLKLGVSVRELREKAGALFLEATTRSKGVDEELV